MRHGGTTKGGINIHTSANVQRYLSGSTHDSASLLWKKHPTSLRLGYVLGKESRLELITIFSNLCVRYIGLPKSYNPFKNTFSLELEERIVTEVLRGDLSLTNSSNPFKIVMSKWNRFYGALWKQQLANRMSKPHLVWESVIEHLVNPSSIFKD